MSGHVTLNLLNELRKKGTMQMLDSIYHITLKLF